MSGGIERKKRVDSKRFYDVLDEAYFLVRDNRLEFLSSYLAGSVPFIVGLMFFIYRLGCLRAGDADVVLWGIILTVLFCWKNLCQCIYCNAMMRIVCGGGEKPSVRQLSVAWARLTAILSVLMLIITLTITAPLPMLCFIPVLTLFGPFIYCISGVVCATETDVGAFSVVRKIFLYLGKRPTVTLGGSLVLLLIMAAILFNLFCFSILIPVLLKKFFDVDTAYSNIDSLGALVPLLFNSTIWSMIGCFAWLMLEPFYTAFCLLKAFYGESGLKGLDLKAEIVKFGKKALLIVLIFMAVPAFSAEKDNGGLRLSGGEVSSEQVEREIKRTLEKSEFKWRDEYVDSDNSEDHWLIRYISMGLEKMMEWIGKYLRLIVDFIENLFSWERKKSDGGLSGWDVAWNIGKYALIAILATLCAYFAIRFFRNRKARNAAAGDSILKTAPDLTDKNVSADELEQGEWLKLGNELLGCQDYMLALRAFYLGCISALADRRLLTVAVGKSDYEYLSELRRRGHSEPEFIIGFSDAIRVFQRVWYGNYPVDRGMAEQVRRQAEVFAGNKASTEGGRI